MTEAEAPPETKTAAGDLEARPEIRERRPAAQAAMDDFLAQAAAKPAAPDMILDCQDGLNVRFKFDHPDQPEAMLLVCQAFGMTDLGAFETLIGQLVNANVDRDLNSARSVNFAKTMIADIKPRDAIETMLAAQMVSVHIALMRHLSMLRSVDKIPQLEIQERAVNKLARPYASQVEALRKHRSGCEQKVEVRHVHIHEGGQAIVGSVTSRDRGEGG